MVVRDDIISVTREDPGAALADRGLRLPAIRRGDGREQRSRHPLSFRNLVPGEIQMGGLEPRTKNGQPL